MKTVIALVVMASTFGTANAASLQEVEHATAQQLQLQTGAPIGPTTIFTHNMTKGRWAWITIYNDTLGGIREVGCVNPNMSYRGFTGYLPPFNYRVRFEMTEGANCG